MINSLKLFFIFSYLLFTPFVFVGQDENRLIKVSVNLKLLSEEIILDSVYTLQNNKIKFTQLRFYIGQFNLKKANKIVFSEGSSYHLIDLRDSKSTTFNLKNPTPIYFDEVNFLFGIDSTTNANGIGEGELDPVKGMYWAWQSGYINAKIEGTIQSNNAIEKKFEFHLGGFLPPYKACREVHFLHNGNSCIQLIFDLSRFIELCDFSGMSILSPGKKAVELSETLSKYFKPSTSEK